MSSTFLAAVAARAADATSCGSNRLGDDCNPLESSDVALVILLHLDLRIRLLAAAVSTSWLAASRRDAELYRICSKGLVSRRASKRQLQRFGRLLGEHTLSLDLSSVLNVDDVVSRDLLTSGGRSREEEGPWARLVGHADARSTARMPNLRTLKLSGCDIGDKTCESLRGMSSLRALHLWAAESVTNDGIALVAVSCPKLAVLDLRCCGEVHRGCVEHLASHCTELVDLRLKGLSPQGLIDDAALGALGAHCPRLTILDVSGGVCTDDGVRALVAGCTKLERLHLAANRRVGDVGVAAVAAACPALRLLDLQGCATIGDAAVRALAARTPALETLSLQCCARVSDAGLIDLVRSCARLRHVTLKNTMVTAAARAALHVERPDVNVVELTPAVEED
jgi:hypothetical protein